MKVTGIVLLVFAALNFLVAIMAASSGADNAAGQKINAALLLCVVGGLLLYLGKKKETKKIEEEKLEKMKKEAEEKRQAEQVSHKREAAELNRKKREQQEQEVEHTGITTIDDVLSDDENDDYPKPVCVLGPEDIAKLMSEEYMDKCISFAAEGGTKEQTQVKIEILLGKREKTAAMLAVERPIRRFFHELYDTAGRTAYESLDNALMRKLAVTTNLMNAYKEANEEDGRYYSEKEEMIEIANKFGVSVNLIESEEKQKATNKYMK